TYNLAGIKTVLRFSPDVLADIFLGKIGNWSDSRIQQINPGLQLPNTDIAVIHRSDGSPATFIFSDYLSKISLEWSQVVHSGTSLNWPVGLGAKGNEGVAGMVRQTEGSIGYVELNYAVVNKLPMGSLQNSAGRFVTANVQSVEEAASSSHIPEDFRV